MEFFSENNNENTNTVDYNNTNSTNNNAASARPFPNVFALFARSLGIFSVFCAVFSIFIGSFICGGLAVILAILSKGYNTKMEKNAVIGLIAGIIGIVLQISTLIFSFYSIIHIPEFREQFNSLYEQMYGEPVDDSINEMLDNLGLPNTEGGLL